MSRRVLVLGLGVTLLGCATHNQINVSNTKDIRIDSVAIVVLEDGAFEVQYARVRDTATGAALLGLVGAAIEAGVSSESDSQRQAEIEKVLGETSPAEALLEAIRTTFESDSDIALSTFDRKIASAESYDATGIFTVEEYGFTLIDRDSEELHPYITFHAKVTGRNGDVIWDDREKLLGRVSATYDELRAPEGPARKLVMEILGEVGARIAYDIIYQ